MSRDRVSGPSGPLFAAVDAGTTGARAVVCGLDGIRLSEKRRRYATVTARPGWAEQDARAWASCALEALGALPATLRARIAAIGLTGQSPSVVAVDASGAPVAPGMIYRDNRAVEEAAELRSLVGAARIHRVTGHTPEAFHVGPKVLWLRRHDPRAFARTRWFLQPRDVVLHRLTGTFLTDESHANCTLFYDLEGHCWADEIFDAVDLGRVFPDAVPSSTVVGGLAASVASGVGIRAGTPIVIGAGDSQCVAYGAGVLSAGPISEMAGASSCLNSAVAAPLDDLRVTHYNHVVAGWYTTELGVNTTGSALQWAVDQLGFAGFEDFAAHADEGTALVLDEQRGGPIDAAPVFLPYLGDGERDDPTIRAAFVGLSDRHDRRTLAYAVVEGVAAGVASVLDVLKAAGSPLEELRVSGGGARLDALGQVKADLLGVPVLHLREDAAGLGVALLAAAATGHPDEVAVARAGLLQRATRFEPRRVGSARLEVRRAWFDDLRRAAALHLPGHAGHR
ncbi:MAG TPA: FGGY family carbohydrate kinase [Acidimicrobiales bacterium]|nr:FGGY family carbohydrate kinase [Acidimicrobiales bacterium]